MGVALELLGGLVAHQLEGVATFDQRLPFGCQSLQLDGLDLGAVLFPLRALLRQLVVVEFALDPIDGAVEDVHRRPEQILEVGFEARIGERHHEGVEDVGDAAGEDVRFGQRPGIGFVLERTVAIELEFVEDLVGRGCAVAAARSSSSWSVVIAAFLRRIGRAHRGLHGDEGSPAGRTGSPSAARASMAKAGYFASRWKGGLLPAAGK